MFDSVLNAVFGCSHRRTTFPLTPSRQPGVSYSAGTAATGTAATYVACLDCGKEFEYDWKSMHLGKPASMVPSARREVLSHANR